MKQKKVLIAIVAICLGLIVTYFTTWRGIIRQRKVKQIKIEQSQTATQSALDNKSVSPITGLPCDNWKRRALAVMQPGDVSARPAAGFSQAEMVIEMPVITASITRLMAVYICNTPPEVGSMRSARHDFIHLAKGLDAIFVPWGRSESHDPSNSVGLAQGILNRQEIENINCNEDAGKSSSLCSVNPCFRKSGLARVDSGYGKPELFWKCAAELGYRLESNFEGYPHQSDLPEEKRPSGGNLRVAFAGPYAVEYNYDKKTNSYFRIWGDEADIDRNNGQRISPKNIAVLIASSSQIEGQYNNVQLGDPWYDTIDNGEAFYYFNGQELRGKWKKDKSRIDSKLYFYDENGAEVRFVPGQIWVEVLEPGQVLRWTPQA